jgi:hypothetical protein
MVMLQANGKAKVRHIDRGQNIIRTERSKAATQATLDLLCQS